jgi:ABC-type antimicrobial peptide transport system permease subunit
LEKALIEQTIRLVVEELLQVIFILILSATKFLTAPITSLNIGFNYIQTLIITTIGGIFGVLVFYYLSNGLAFIFYKIAAKLNGVKKPKEKKVFTWKNKMIVKTVRQYGLLGVALLTPVILSIPLGTFIAARYFHNQAQVLKYLSASVIFWSVIISSLVIAF